MFGVTLDNIYVPFKKRQKKISCIMVVVSSQTEENAVILRCFCHFPDYYLDIGTMEKVGHFRKWY